jgi:hypothetical protein
MLHPRATDFQDYYFLDDLLNHTTLMLKFCTNKQIWASLLRQVCFFWGKGGVSPPKGCNAPSAGYGFPRKKGSFFLGWERGRFAPKKGVTLAPSMGYRFPRKKIPPQAQSKYSHSEYFAPPTRIGI